MSRPSIHKQRYYLSILLIGITVGAICSRFFRPEIAILIGWDVGVVLLNLLLWNAMRGQSADQTARIARHEHLNHTAIDTMLLFAAVASLVGVGTLFLSNQTTSSADSTLHILFGILSTLLSWATIHTLYTLRYAAMYYRSEKGGVDFGNQKPSFSDFMYLAFTIGMTYQTSDTDLQTTAFRRVALRHALLSFLFGMAILATTINLVVSLLA